jgi:hypothetical protein
MHLLHTNRAVSPRLEGFVISRLNRLDWASVSLWKHSIMSAHTRHILVASERGCDERAVRERDAVLRRWWEEALEERDGRVEDDVALATSLGADVDLLVVDKLAVDTADVRWARAVEVRRAQVCAELVGLGLPRPSALVQRGAGRHTHRTERSRLGLERLVCDRVLEVLEPVAVAREDDDAADEAVLLRVREVGRAHGASRRECWRALGSPPGLL